MILCRIPRKFFENVTKFSRFSYFAVGNLRNLSINWITCRCTFNTKYHLTFTRHYDWENFSKNTKNEGNMSEFWNFLPIFLLKNHSLKWIKKGKSKNTISNFPGFWGSSRYFVKFVGLGIWELGPVLIAAFEIFLIYNCLPLKIYRIILIQNFLPKLKFSPQLAGVQHLEPPCEPIYIVKILYWPSLLSNIKF